MSDKNFGETFTEEGYAHRVNIYLKTWKTSFIISTDIAGTYLYVSHDCTFPVQIILLVFDR